MKRKIYIVTLAPAIDYILRFDQFEKGSTNRPYEIDMYAAGKGIHVSMMMNSLQQENESIIFTSGDFEEFFLNDLDKSGVKYKKFNSKENIRINLKIIDNDQTEASVSGPKIALSEIEKMNNYLLENLIEGDVLIITGSAPKNLGNNIYQQISHIANVKKALLVVDAFGPLLTNALKEKPFLIKPNFSELEMTTNLKINSEKQAIEAARILINGGVENVLISNGSKGAILVTKDKAYTGTTPKTEFSLNNAAGAGDSMLAGFISEYIKTKNLKESLKMSLLSGSATAFSERIADSEMMKKMIKHIETIEIKEI